MTRLLLANFLVAHGAARAPIWIAPYTGSAPFNPGRSRLLHGRGRDTTAMRAIGIALALLGTIPYARRRALLTAHPRHGARQAAPRA